MEDNARTFGSFELRPAQRVLLENGNVIRLGGRALEILIALTERPGELIGKEELIARVWPNVIVEEAALRVHIAALRKFLGDGRSGTRFITNVPGRGYTFVGTVNKGTQSSASGRALSHRLPQAQSRMVGRREVVVALADKVMQRGFVTIVGHGGVGKTTTALGIAETLLEHYPDGIYFADLGAVGNPSLVLGVVASALGLATDVEDRYAAIATFVAGKRLLLILDGCEHVIDAAADIAETISKLGNETAHLLATSREPLRASGEWVHRLPPLAFPPDTPSMSAADVLSFPAVQLFMERASAASDAFMITEANADTIGSICRRLDGIPLAIELVAARVDSMGVPGLPMLMKDPHRLLSSRGRRTARARHQTLRAALNWSYELLNPVEKAILRRLGVFVGSTSIEAVLAVAIEDDIVAADCEEAIASLVTKSLVVADISQATVQYRLLDTTRFYAIEQLAELGELDAIARRHATYFRDLFKTAAQEAEVQTASQWLPRYTSHLENVRAALDWSFSTKGDPAVGVELTLAAAPLWTWLVQVAEAQISIERALGAPPEHLDDRTLMRLNGALGGATSIADIASRRMITAHSAALALAEKLGDVDQQLRALWGLWVYHLDQGEFRVGLEVGRRFYQAAQHSNSRNDQVIGQRLVGYALYLLGDLEGARSEIERVLRLLNEKEGASEAFRFQFDQRAVARMTYALILWMQGFPEQATHWRMEADANALAIGHSTLVGNVIIKSSGPLAILTADNDALANYVGYLASHAAPQALWPFMVRIYAGLLDIRCGRLSEGIRCLRTALAGIGERRFTMPRTWAMSVLALAEAQNGERDCALQTIGVAIARVEADEERWCYPEVLRVKGEILQLAYGETGCADAIVYFQRAMEISQHQGALSWELRAATSLARLWHRQAMSKEAADLLSEVYGRFTEGFATADLEIARALLDDIRASLKVQARSARPVRKVSRSAASGVE